MSSNPEQPRGKDAGNLNIEQKLAEIQASCPELIVIEPAEANGDTWRIWHHGDSGIRAQSRGEAIAEFWQRLQGAEAKAETQKPKLPFKLDGDHCAHCGAHYASCECNIEYPSAPIDRSLAESQLQSVHETEIALGAVASSEISEPIASVGGDETELSGVDYHPAWIDENASHGYWAEYDRVSKIMRSDLESAPTAAEPVLDESEKVPGNEFVMASEYAGVTFEQAAAVACSLVNCGWRGPKTPIEPAMQAKYAAMMKRMAGAIDSIIKERDMTDAIYEEAYHFVFKNQGAKFWNELVAALAAYREMGLEK